MIDRLYGCLCLLILHIITFSKQYPCLFSKIHILYCTKLNNQNENNIHKACCQANVTLRPFYTCLHKIAHYTIQLSIIS